MYYGGLDDVCVRYPFGNQYDLEAVKRDLLLGVIYGRQVFINEGYLVANPTLLGEMENLHTSLLGNLITIGAARLYARGGRDVAGGIKAGMEKIPTHAKRAEQHPQLLDSIDILGGMAASHVIAWPDHANTGELYWNALEEAAGNANFSRDMFERNDADRARFDRVLKQASQSIGSKFQGVRTAVEAWAWHDVSQGAIDPDSFDPYDPGLSRHPRFGEVQTLMRVANEVYHLAQSIGAFTSLQSAGADVEHASVFTQTRFAMGSYFDIDKVDAALDGDSDDFKNMLDQLILTLNDFTGCRDYSFVRALYLSSDLRSAREAYLRAISGFIQGGTSFEAAASARDRFKEAFSQVILHYVNRPLSLRLIELGVSMVAPAAGAAASGVTALAQNPFTSGVVAEVMDVANRMTIRRLHRASIESRLGRAAIEASQDAQPGLLAERALKGQRFGYAGDLDATTTQRLLAKTRPFMP